jgi:23S rRNA (pseudouridine1915-N3)-methyltransferase
MKRIHMIAVGRLKTPCWRDAAAYYAKRLARSLTLRESLVRDADARLEPAMRKKQEAERLLKMHQKGEVLVCLDENGESHTSEQFAGWLRGLSIADKRPASSSAAHTVSTGAFSGPRTFAFPWGP